MASWEDRFYLGLSQTLQAHSVKRLFSYYYQEYADWSCQNRERMQEFCSQNGVEMQERGLTFSDPIKTWNQLNSDINDLNGTISRVLLDISTMPRETIWVLLFLLEKKNIQIDYVYHKPIAYDPDWLSRDPGKPRLVLNQSGIFKLGSKTTLFIITGFDPLRTEQLINIFEPKTILLGFQPGEQFESARRNLKKHMEILKPFQEDVRYFESDSYSIDHGLATLLGHMENHLEDNIVLSSLGPKPSAIALYLAKKKFPEVALAYAPSNDFNRNYSKGLGKGIFGSIPVGLP